MSLVKHQFQSHVTLTDPLGQGCKKCGLTAVAHPDEDEAEYQMQMGFAQSVGDPSPHGKHKHEFRICDGSSPYFKNYDARLSFIMLFCSCGDTKEVIAEDRR